jgi:hypothetical protein
VISKLDTIKSLIALSASDNVEESRTAAHTACRMIREGKFIVVVGGQERPAFAPGGGPAPAESKAYPSREWRDYVPRGWSADEVPSGVKYRPTNKDWEDAGREQFKWRSTAGASPGTYSNGPTPRPFMDPKSFEDMIDAMKKAGIL